MWRIRERKAGTVIFILFLLFLLWWISNGYSQDDRVDKLIEDLKSENWNVRWGSAK